VEGSHFKILADTVISAVGQLPDYGIISKGLSRAEGNLRIDPASMRTDVDGLFAAGDFVNGPTTVVEAMASGKKAALAVEEYFGKKDD